MNKLVLSSFLFLYSFQYAWAQDSEYKPATIYTRTGDTLVCQLKNSKSYTSLGNFYYLMPGDKKEKKIYKDDIQLLLVDQDVYCFFRIHYKYAAGVETKVFQELVKGHLTLYAKTYVQTQSLTPGGQRRGSGETYQDYFIKKDGVDEIKKIGRVGFKKKILTYVDRYDQLSAKIYSKEYRMDDLRKIVEEYNLWYTEKHPQ